MSQAVTWSPLNQSWQKREPTQRNSIDIRRLAVTRLVTRKKRKIKKEQTGYRKVQALVTQKLKASNASGTVSLTLTPAITWEDQSKLRVSRWPRTSEQIHENISIRSRNESIVVAKNKFKLWRWKLGKTKRVWHSQSLTLTPVRERSQRNWEYSGWPWTSKRGKQSVFWESHDRAES